MPPLVLAELLRQFVETGDGAAAYALSQVYDRHWSILPDIVPFLVTCFGGDAGPWADEPREWRVLCGRVAHGQAREAVRQAWDVAACSGSVSTACDWLADTKNGTGPESFAVALRALGDRQRALIRDAANTAIRRSQQEDPAGTSGAEPIPDRDVPARLRALVRKTGLAGMWLFNQMAAIAGVTEAETALRVGESNLQTTHMASRGEALGSRRR